MFPDVAVAFEPRQDDGSQIDTIDDSVSRWCRDLHRRAAFRWEFRRSL